MGFGGGFGSAVQGGLSGYAATGNYWGAAAGAAAGYLNKPKKAPSGDSGSKAPKAPKPPPDQTSFQRPQTLDGAPNYLMTSGGLNSAMTPLQQRAHIATQGASGDLGADPEVIDYYKNLALRSMVDQKGKAFGEPLPIEREYLEQVLGQSPYNASTESFLSALLRV